MTTQTASTERAPITFTVKSSADGKYTTLILPLTTLVSDLKQELSHPKNADIPAECQQLVYSGSVLKDTDTLETYNIKDSHTIHLVKSAPANQQLQNTAAQGMGEQGAEGGAAGANPPTGPPEIGNLGCHYGPAPAIQYDEYYAKELGSLEEMGFSNSQKNLDALIKAKGDVSDAIELLSKAM
ncbi:hypothetical protein N7465_001362 [Penicillium sp. CMV-2018d]|nr:hypothetical protein N7465_001362 [Penicillium sp. CMV-2018d]